MMDSNVTGVYKISCLTTGKFYIGSAHSLVKRKRTHLSCLRNKKHRNSKLQRAWEKYGEENFIFETLLICSKDDVLFYEQLLLTKLDAVQNGFNISPSVIGGKGVKHTEKTKAKLKEAWIQRRMRPKNPVSEETKKKISLAKLGQKRKPFTEEARRNMAISRMGNKNRLGIPHTEETKLKMKLTREAKRNQDVN
jgi:group I intron endonuclease